MSILTKKKNGFNHKAKNISIPRNKQNKNKTNTRKNVGKSRKNIGVKTMKGGWGFKNLFKRKSNGSKVAGAPKSKFVLPPVLGVSQVQNKTTRNARFMTEFINSNTSKPLYTNENGRLKVIRSKALKMVNKQRPWYSFLKTTDPVKRAELLRLFETELEEKYPNVGEQQMFNVNKYFAELQKPQSTENNNLTYAKLPTEKAEIFWDRDQIDKIRAQFPDMGKRPNTISSSTNSYANTKIQNLKEKLKNLETSTSDTLNVNAKKISNAKKTGLDVNISNLIEAKQKKHNNNKLKLNINTTAKRIAERRAKDRAEEIKKQAEDNGKTINLDELEKLKQKLFNNEINKVRSKIATIRGKQDIPSQIAGIKEEIPHIKEHIKDQILEFERKTKALEEIKPPISKVEKQESIIRLNKMLKKNISDLEIRQKYLETRLTQLTDNLSKTGTSSVSLGASPSESSTDIPNPRANKVIQFENKLEINKKFEKQPKYLQDRINDFKLLLQSITDKNSDEYKKTAVALATVVDIFVNLPPKYMSMTKPTESIYATLPSANKNLEANIPENEQRQDIVNSITALQ